MATKKDENLHKKIEHKEDDEIRTKQKTNCNDDTDKEAQGESSFSVEEEDIYGEIPDVPAEENDIYLEPINRTYLEVVEGQTPRPSVVPLPEVRPPILERALANRSAGYTWWTGRRKLKLIIVAVIVVVAVIIALSTTLKRETTTSPVRRLSKPVLELDVRKQNRHIEGWLWDVAALPGGRAVVSNYIESNKTDLVWLLDKDGVVNKLLYYCVQCSAIHSFIVRNSDTLIVHKNGSIAQVELDSAVILKTYKVPDVEGMIQWGHPTETEDPNRDVILLADYIKKQVFTYRLSTGEKEVKINSGLKEPNSVYKQAYNSQSYYVVCDMSDHKIKIYNSIGGLIRETEGEGSEDGQLDLPYTAVPSPEGDIIVADTLNNRVSVFDLQLQFKYHLLTNFSEPIKLYSKAPFIWISDNDGINYNVYRYRLYR